MIKLLTNNIEKLFELSEFELDEIDGDAVIFLPKEGKILALNGTASFIWNKLVASQRETIELSVDTLASEVMLHYNCDEDSFDSIADDVTETIGLLVDSRALILQDV